MRVGLCLSSTKDYGSSETVLELAATATILFSFSPDLTLTLLTQPKLCVLCSPDQPNKSVQ